MESDSSQNDARALKARLPRVWSALFARYGNFTPVQLRAIPAILDGDSALVIAATAGGKTEAVLAPLLERLLQAERVDGKLRILYICPTRALVNDLYARLELPLTALRIPIATKTGDTGQVSVQAPPAVLITTPESTDSLLTRAPRLLTTLDAVVLDEIHLFDHSPRGDQLRCLLARMEHVRRYAHQAAGEAGEFAPLQRVALSATVPDPHGIVDRYLAAADRSTRIIEVAGGRKLTAVVELMSGLAELPQLLARRSAGQSGLRKSLLFCNTRNEVEQTAAYLRDHLPYAAEIFVHYSNLDPGLRRQTESGFAAAGVAICVSSSTLELGIDIGSIDDVVLLGPPPTLTSFLQRVGRGGRRTAGTHVLCLARSLLEEARFQALIGLARNELALPAVAQPRYHFRPSVLVQQCFSILKQSPTGALRPADLARAAPPEMDERARLRLLSELGRRDFLRTARLGEWQPGPALEPLLDDHEIYSNIGNDPLSLSIVDAYTGRTLAQTQRSRQVGETLLLGGRTVEVVWRDRYRIAVRWGAPGMADEVLRFQTAPFAVPLDVTLAIARQLGLQPGDLYMLPAEKGTWLFHFWGDIYGALLAGLLRHALLMQPHAVTPPQHDAPGEDEGVIVTRVNELCLHVNQPLSRGTLGPALWDDRAARRTLQILRPELAAVLALGRFHSLLPPDLAVAIVDALIDLPRFEQLMRHAALSPVPSGLRDGLAGLAG